MKWTLAQLSNQSQAKFPLAWKTPVAAKKAEPELSSHELSIIQNRAESVVVRLPSGLIHNSKTALVREIFSKNADGSINWRKTLVLRERAATQA
jgi:hypothetical protein